MVKSKDRDYQAKEDVFNLTKVCFWSVAICLLVIALFYGAISSTTIYAAANAKLPDPFLFSNGTRMTSIDQWAARRAEISALAQRYEYGTKPPVPDTVGGSYSSNRITVNVSEGGKSISFSCSIAYPRTGQAPYPAIIGVGGSFLNNSVISSLGVAVISFPNDDIAAQTNTGSRGQGKFYTIYGRDHSAGALIAWAWGVDCLITALEKTPAAKIDPQRLGVTGCSRNGKGALACGAFCERIALTIPQESGSGGAASWRVSDAQKASGQNVQTLSQIVGENCWFSTALNQFRGQTNNLPFDHHEILALCAPRALLVIENTSMEWLGKLSTWTTANAAHMVWEAFGIPDKMGFSQVGHGDHCGFPSSQQPELTAYINKFLIGNGTGNTNIMKTDGGLYFDKAKWVNWTIPSLAPANSASPTVSPSPSGTAQPSATATPSITLTPTPSASSGAKYAVSYTQYDWGSGATVSVTIKNKSAAALDGWKLAFGFSGNQKITNAWNCTYTQNGTAVTCANAVYNAAVTVNGSVSFGFNISYSGTNNKPTSFTLDGVACLVE
jgi:hypothetical protein